MEADSLPVVGTRALVSYEKQQLWGTVKFAGTTSFAQGDWVGVALDDPVGKNSGTVKDVKYFECDANHGVFIRPKSVLKSDGQPASPSEASTAASSPTSPKRMAAKAAAKGSADMLQTHDAKILALQAELSRQTSGVTGTENVVEALRAARADVSKVLDLQAKQERDFESVRLDLAQERKARAAQVEKMLELETTVFAQGLNGANTKKLDLLTAQVQSNMESLKAQCERIRAAEISLNTLCAEVGRLSDEVRSLKQNQAREGDADQLPGQARTLSSQSGSSAANADVSWLSFIGLSCAARPGRQPVSEKPLERQRPQEFTLAGAELASCKDAELGEGRKVAPPISASTGEA